MQKPLIKVGYLVSYDYKYLEYSLPFVYEYADSINIAIDKDRKTWSGGNFDLPASFFEWLEKYDTDNKIRIYEDSFYVPQLTPMECDTRERNMLADFMGEGGWHIQVDSDEYFVDFRSFVEYLKSLDIRVPVSIFAEWITIYRQKDKDYFIIDSNEMFALATNSPNYSNARRQENIKEVYTTFKVLHQSWGRSEDEMEQKLKNWSHTADFNTKSYFDLWKVIDKHTYKYLHNFHPLYGPDWKELEYVEADNIKELIEKVNEMQKAKVDKDKRSKSLYSRIFKKKRI